MCTSTSTHRSSKPSNCTLGYYTVFVLFGILLGSFTRYKPSSFSLWCRREGESNGCVQPQVSASLHLKMAHMRIGCWHDKASRSEFPRLTQEAVLGRANALSTTLRVQKPFHKSENDQDRWMWRTSPAWQKTIAVMSPDLFRTVLWPNA